MLTPNFCHVHGPTNEDARALTIFSIHETAVAGTRHN
jgi:hypothetical protein